MFDPHHGCNQHQANVSPSESSGLMCACYEFPVCAPFDGCELSSLRLCVGGQQQIFKHRSYSLTETSYLYITVQASIGVGGCV